MTKPIIDRLLPVPNDSGFRQEGYFVWCGSMIRDGVKGSGHPTHLITGVLYQGHSWCVVQEISPPKT